MRYSRVEWIGEIPDNWKLYKLGSLFNLRNVKVSDKEYQPLSVSRGGIVLQMENVAKSDASDDRKLVLKGDFAINSRSDRKQSCGVAPFDGSVSLTNTILYPKNSNYVFNEYLNYLMKNYGFAEEFYRWGHGIVADLWTTRYQEMKDILLPLPTVETQQKIYEFLNRKCSEIDELIEIENKQIERLEEYKKSFIFNSLKSLDSKYKMRFKFLNSFNNTGESIDKNYWTNDETDSLFYTAGREPIRCCYKNFPKEKYTDDNDILLSRNGTPYVYLPVVHSMYTDHIIRVRLKNYVNKKYLKYALENSMLGVVVDSVSLPTWSIFVWNNREFPYPPKEKQVAIVNYLDEKCLQINELMELKNKKIEQLKEYKKSLIYEYVTGKKEVDA